MGLSLPKKPNQSFWNKVVDQFSANTQADQYRRAVAAQQPQRQAASFNQPTQQVSFGTNGVGRPSFVSQPNPVSTPKPSVSWNQPTNPVTFQKPSAEVQLGARPTPIGNQSVPQTTPRVVAPMQSNPVTRFFAPIIKPAQQFGNMVVAGGEGAVGLADLGLESVFGTDQSYKDKLHQVNSQLDKRLSPTGGTFGAGMPTGFQSPQQTQKDFIQDPSKIKSMVGTGAELGSYTIGMPAVRGLTSGGKLVAPAVGKFIANTAGAGALGMGGHEAAKDGSTAKSIATQAGIGAVTGPVVAGAFGLSGKGIGSIFSKITSPKIVKGANGQSVLSWVDNGKAYHQEISPKDYNAVVSMIDSTNPNAANNPMKNVDGTVYHITAGENVLKNSKKVGGQVDAQALSDSLGTGTDKIVPQTTKPSVVKSEKPVVGTVEQNTKDLQDAAAFANNDTSVIKDPSKFKRAWASVTGVLSNYGDTGKLIAKKLEDSRATSEIGQQKTLTAMPAVQKLKGNGEFEQFVNALEDLSAGKVPKTTPRIQQAILEWNQEMPAIRDAALKAGLEVGDLGPNYFPHIFKNDKQPVFSTSQAHTSAFGNLVKSRDSVRTDFEKTHDAMIRYINGAWDSIAKAEHFGPRGEVISNAREQLASQGINPNDHFDHFLNIALGNVDKGTAGYKVASSIKKFNAVTSLGMAGISNATQTTNTATVAGIGRLLNGIRKNVFDPAARQKAVDAGVLLESGMKQMAEQNLGLTGKVMSNIASPFFYQIEKFNRQVTGIVGADWGNHLAGQVAKGNVKAEEALRGLGVTGDIGPNLTRSQEIQSARGLVKVSQFKVEPQDMPGWANSAAGSVAAQFRSFGYKQTGFMWNQVLNKALHGDLVPLARFIAVGAPAGYAANYARDFVAGKLVGDQPQNDKTGGEKALGAVNTGIAQVGGYGLPGSMIQGAKYAMDSNHPVENIASTVLGPTAGLITKTKTNLETGITKGNWQPLENQALSKIPTVGRYVASRVAPYDASTTTKAGATPKKDASIAELNAQTSADVKALSANSKPGDYGIEQGANGKYVVTVDGQVSQVKTLQEARDAVAKDIFGNSSDNIKIVGENVYRKDASGKVQTTTKTKYDYQIGTAELTKYKAAGDLKNWMTTAQKQLDSIDKQLQDPNIDQLDAITLQNQAQALMDNMDKYAGYGGFKKGSGGGGSSGSNPYNYAVSINAGGNFPKSTVKIAGATTKLGVAMKSTTNKPKVTIKKSLV